MKQRISETHIKKFCAEMINYIPGCRADIRMAGINKSGEPDITGIVNRIRLEIEYKVPGRKPTDLQAKELRSWENLGAIVGVSHSVIETIQVISTHITPEQIKKIKEFLVLKQRAILLKEQIKEALYYIDTFLL